MKAGGICGRMTGRVVQITTPGDGSCADYVLPGIWQWSDVLGVGEIGPAPGAQ